MGTELRIIRIKAIAKPGNLGEILAIMEVEKNLKGKYWNYEIKQ